MRKKLAFQGVPNMTIVTPSQWLADEVKKSFLTEYPVEIRYNSINRDVLKPSESSFRAEHGLEDKIMVLGVANIWEKRKGLDDFIKLAKMLDQRNDQIPDDSNEKKYKVVLVGLTQKQIGALEKDGASILVLPRTSSAQELAQIYTAADVFVNMTREDNYPTVNLEAEACGTPVISYDTGGCKETISRPDSYADCRSVDDVYSRILSLGSKPL
jgi:glycosyltransferase involved in cell wall biosynthesis